MKAIVPPELVDLLTFAVQTVLEHADDVCRFEWVISRFDGKHRQVRIEGTSWETFLALSKAGCPVSWYADHEHVGELDGHWAANIVGPDGAP